MIKGILFDMDDTLINSHYPHRDSLKWLFAKRGIDTSTLPNKIEKTFFGMPIVQVVKTIADHYHIDEDPQKLLVERDVEFLKLFQEVKPMPGFEKLKLFLEKKEYSCAIATASPKQYADIVLNKFNLRKIFSGIVTQDDVTKSKPNPEVFLLAAKQLKLPPNECVVIEDASKGIQAATAAGMKSIGVQNQFIKEFQDISKATIQVNNLSEVEAAIKQLR